MDSNPTPRAKLTESSNRLKYQNKQNNNIQLYDSPSVTSPIQ